MHSGPKIGVLALQGDVREHRSALAELGVEAVDVRSPADLEDLDGLVLPGGESTTMSLLLASSGLWEPLGQRIDDGLAVFGTCAGMILLATEVVDGRPDQRRFGAIDIAVRRNAFGRQVNSFETELDVSRVDGGPFHAVFIRAPAVVGTGAQVEVLASVPGPGGDRAQRQPVVCRQGPVLVAAFHPELSRDVRLHRLFLESVAKGSIVGYTTGR